MVRNVYVIFHWLFDWGNQCSNYWFSLIAMKQQFNTKMNLFYAALISTIQTSMETIIKTFRDLYFWCKSRERKAKRRADRWCSYR
eukprot:UN09906